MVRDHRRQSWTYHLDWLPQEHTERLLNKVERSQGQFFREKKQTLTKVFPINGRKEWMIDKIV